MIHFAFLFFVLLLNQVTLSACQQPFNAQIPYSFRVLLPSVDGTSYIPAHYVNDPQMGMAYALLEQLASTNQQLSSEEVLYANILANLPPSNAKMLISTVRNHNGSNLVEIALRHLHPKLARAMLHTADDAMLPLIFCPNHSGKYLIHAIWASLQMATQVVNMTPDINAYNEYISVIKELCAFYTDFIASYPQYIQDPSSNSIALAINTYYAEYLNCDHTPSIIGFSAVSLEQSTNTIAPAYPAQHIAAPAPLTTVSNVATQSPQPTPNALNLPSLDILTPSIPTRSSEQPAQQGPAQSKQKRQKLPQLEKKQAAITPLQSPQKSPVYDHKKSALLKNLLKTQPQKPPSGDTRSKAQSPTSDIQEITEQLALVHIPQPEELIAAASAQSTALKSDTPHESILESITHTILESPRDLMRLLKERQDEIKTITDWRITPDGDTPRTLALFHNQIFNAEILDTIMLEVSPATDKDLLTLLLWAEMRQDEEIGATDPVAWETAKQLFNYWCLIIDSKIPYLEARALQAHLLEVPELELPSMPDDNLLTVSTTADAKSAIVLFEERAASNIEEKASPIPAISEAAPQLTNTSVQTPVGADALNTLFSIINEAPEKLKKWLKLNKKKLKKHQTWSIDGCTPRTLALRKKQIQNAQLIEEIMQHIPATEEDLALLLDWAEQNQAAGKTQEFNVAKSLFAQWYRAISSHTPDLVLRAVQAKLLTDDHLREIITAADEEDPGIKQLIRLIIQKQQIDIMATANPIFLDLMKRNISLTTAACFNNNQKIELELLCRSLGNTDLLDMLIFYQTHQFANTISKASSDQSLEDIQNTWNSYFISNLRLHHKFFNMLAKTENWLQLIIQLTKSNKNFFKICATQERGIIALSDAIEAGLFSINTFIEHQDMIDWLASRPFELLKQLNSDKAYIGLLAKLLHAHQSIEQSSPLVLKLTSLYNDGNPEQKKLILDTVLRDISLDQIGALIQAFVNKQSQDPIFAVFAINTIVHYYTDTCGAQATGSMLTSLKNHVLSA